MVDREKLPRPAPEVIEDGIPATTEIPAEVLITGDPLEGEVPPLDRFQAATDWGTTASEQLGSEPMDVRLGREEPDVDLAGAHTERQLFEPGADAGLADDEADAVGEVDGRFEDTLSAEEAAMRVVDEPPGMSFDPDPGYVEDQDLGR